MKRALIWGALAALLLFAFDRMMAHDKALLCESDATAYKGCFR